jgi:hypothetical protein
MWEWMAVYLHKHTMTTHTLTAKHDDGRRLWRRRRWPDALSFAAGAVVALTVSFSA